MHNTSAEQIIRQELTSDETLIWNGRPKQGIKLRSSDIFLIPFSLMWGGFAIFWETSVLFTIKNAGPAGIIGSIFGIPFVIIGLYLIFGRFIVDSKQRQNTFYGLTNKRIIIISGIFTRKIDTVNLTTLPNISLNEKSDGTGTILLGLPSPWGYMGNLNAAWPGMPKTSPSLEMIDNVREVYTNIQAAQQGQTISPGFK